MRRQSRAASRPVARLSSVAAAIFAVTLIAGCSTDPEDAAGGPRADGAEDSAAECVATPVTPGEQERTMMSGGVERDYLLYVPESYDPGKSATLIMNLHGSASNPRQQMDGANFAAVAEEHGFIMVAPQGSVPLEVQGFSGWAWNIPGVLLSDGGDGKEAPPGPDDVLFLEELVDAERSAFCADTVIVTGSSTGGRMASYLGCASDRFDAIAPAAGLRVPEDCKPKRAVDVLAIHGTADPVNGYEGGGNPPWGDVSVPDSLAHWAQLMSCQAGPAREQLTEHVVEDAWTECTGGVEVRLVTVNGGGHTWPGAAPNPELEKVAGPITQEVNAGELIFERLVD
ncbi:alpha/beta hydrolase family esterase [Williamsia muralis]|uniref:alpha/beta hydrolase family esterase n=1 Tax=Williamsia marianensis TaxID=85044 RepID=UPI0037FFD2BA